MAEGDLAAAEVAEAAWEVAEAVMDGVLAEAAG